MRKGLIILFLLISSTLAAQTILNIEGQTYVSNDPAWTGVTINWSTPTTFTFRNNSITCVNSGAHMLSAGAESTTSSDNNLDGEVLTGNKVTWNGTGTPEAEGLLLGYNKNQIVEYNYLDKTPYGAVFKSGNSSSGNMTSTSGGFAYNIVKNTIISIRVKGMNGVPIYNNTFFDNTNSSNAFIYISLNPDNGRAASTGTKIKNNIFYTTTGKAMIYAAEAGDLSGLDCDYNVYYNATGNPRFFTGSSWVTFSQWQSLGYDLHSIVINPQFIDVISLVPTARLNNGTDLGTSFQTGLSTTASWVVGSSPATTTQNGTWQVGARIYGTSSVAPNYISSVIENSTPTLLDMTYSLTLANIIPPVSAFNVLVNSITRNIQSVAIVGGKVRLTLASPVVYGDTITVAYTKPASNPLQTVSGDLATSITSQPVVNNCINIYPVVIITSPGNGSSFTAPANITITATASDIDGKINKVEFYNGTTKLGESTTTPFSFIWNNVAVGTYSITAVAIDNFNAKTTSSPILFSINTGTPPVNLPPSVSIVSPGNGSSFISPANILISVIASDPDGTISKLEFFNGAIKLGELTAPPYQFNWTNVKSGTYALIAIATDNLNASSTSTSVVIHINPSTDLNTELINLFPNPNIGNFTIEIKNPSQSEDNQIFIFNSTGKKVYSDVLLKNETTKQFDLFYLDSGLYLLVITGKKTLFTNKFIKN